MNCIILDDEPHAIEVLRRYAEKTPSLDVVGEFRNPLKALDFLQQESVDLIFLDVNMPNLTGIQFLKALKHKPMIIFTTAYSSYAAESYEWEALDYLVKPIVFERFLKAISKVREAFQGGVSHQSKALKDGRPEEVISLKSGKQTHLVKLSDILFVTKQSNYLEVHTLDRKILIRANMGDIFSWLPEEQFMRIHKSYVINVGHVSVIEAHQVKINKTVLPLGASYRKAFAKRFEN